MLPLILPYMFTVDQAQPITYVSKLLGRSFLTWTENQAAHIKNSYTIRGISKPVGYLKLLQKGTSMIKAKEPI